jgi:hypothetical protein
MNLLWGLALVLGLAHAEPVVGPGEIVPRAESLIVRPALAPILPASVQLPGAASLELPEFSAPAVPQAQALPDTPAQSEIHETAFMGLDRFQQSVKMSAGNKGGDDGPQGPGSGQFWDGEHENEEAHQEELVYVERKQQRAEAVQYAHAEIPPLDYRRNHFNKEESQELLAQAHEWAGGSATGGQFLEMLMTAHAVLLDRELDPSRLDMSLFGKSETEIRGLIQEKDYPVYVYHDFLKQAFNYGLVYRVNDSSRSKTYYGIPYHVREALGLKSEEEAPAKPAEKPAEPTAFSHALSALAEEAEALPAKDELFEFTAQTVEAAIKAGQLDEKQVSQSFRDRADAIDLDESSLHESLLTLLESSHGTKWFDGVLSVCRHAVAAGALNGGRLQQTLKDLGS